MNLQVEVVSFTRETSNTNPVLPIGLQLPHGAWGDGRLDATVGAHGVSPGGLDCAPVCAVRFDVTAAVDAGLAPGPALAPGCAPGAATDEPLAPCPGVAGVDCPRLCASAD